MIRTSGSTYAAVALVVYFAWPLMFLAAPDQREGITWAAVLCGASIALYALAHVRCGSLVCSYWTGLSVVGGAWRTGIIQLSMIITTPIILVAHAIGIVLALASLVLGKAWGQRAFIRLCYTMSRHKFDLRQALAALAPEPAHV